MDGVDRIHPAIVVFRYISRNLDNGNDQNPFFFVIKSNSPLKKLKEKIGKTAIGLVPIGNIFDVADCIIGEISCSSSTKP